MFSKILQFVQEVRIELGKVTWPSREEMIGSTGVVILVSIMMSLFIGSIDIILSKIVAWLVR
ncbi:preprotein translocase subunit SecE [candidate division TA06 bacterium]|nr:preprotein translocase subunit SecE [candidate division TA06 bacterium]